MQRRSSAAPGHSDDARWQTFLDDCDRFRTIDQRVETEVAGSIATGQVTSDSFKYPCQEGRGAMQSSLKNYNGSAVFAIPDQALPDAGAARRPAYRAAPSQKRGAKKPGSRWTLRWREMNSNFRSLSQRSGGFGLSSRGIR
jgi:hypothetical protein